MPSLGAPPFNTNSELYVHVKRLNAVRNSANVASLTCTNGNAGQAARNGTVFQERWVNNCLYAFERKTPDEAQIALVLLNACGTDQKMTNLQTDIGSGWKQETTYGFRWINPDAGFAFLVIVIVLVIECPWRERCCAAGGWRFRPQHKISLYFVDEHDGDYEDDVIAIYRSRELGREVCANQLLQAAKR